MKSKEKNGISLIFLVITIVIMIILASAIILSMNDNNQAENAREADVKSDVASLMEEFNNYNSNLLFENATSVDTYNKNQINIDLNGNVIYDGTEKDNISIKDIIPSIDDSRYKDKVFIAYGEIYIDNRNNSLSEKEKTWIKEAGINILDSGVILVINTNSLRLNIGESQTLKVMALPDFNEDVQLSWSSEASDIASVVEGVVTAKTEGVTKITASTDTSSASCTVKVGDFPVYDIASIKLDINDLTLSVGQSKKLNATITPNEASISNLVWKSSNSDIATVDSNGLVIGVSPGSTVITVSNEDGTVSDTCNVKVSSSWMPVTSVELNKNNLVLGRGQSETLIATVFPTYATNKNVTWSTDDSNIAIVDQQGKVTAVNEGQTVITVTTEFGQKTDKCVVTVTEAITLEASVANTTSNSIALKISANTTYGNISTIQVKRNIKGNSSVTINTIDVNNTSYTNNSYNITELVPNTTYEIEVVTLLNDGTSKNVKLEATTKKVDVSDIKLNQTNIEIVERNTYTLVATILPSNATNKTVHWSSNNENIATVDINGKVTAKSKGTAIITAKSADNSSKVVTCTVNVVEAVAELRGTYYATLQDAFDDLWETPIEDETYLGDQIINIVRDFNVSTASTIQQNTYANINMNGKTITSIVDCEIIINNGDLSIIDTGKLKGYSTEGNHATIKNNANLTINGNVTVEGGYNAISNSSNLTILNGTITGGFDDVISNGGTVNLKGGTITSNNCNGIWSGIVNMTGGTIDVNNIGIYLVSGASTIKGGTVHSKNDKAIDVEKGATLTLGENESNGIPSQTNPSIISDNTSALYNEGTFNYYDGVISGKVTSGAIDGAINSKPTGYYPTSKKDATKEIITLKQAVARINDTYYETLQDAFNDSSSNPVFYSYIYLLRDFEVTSTQELESERYVNLFTEGYVVTSKTDSEYIIKNWGSMHILGDGTLTNSAYYVINNQGKLDISTVTIESTYNNGYGIYNSKELNIHSGTVKGVQSAVFNSSSVSSIRVEGGNLQSTSNYAISVGSGTITVTNGNISSNQSGIFISTGKVYVNGGTVEGKGTSAKGVYASSTGTIEVNGGTIKGYSDGILCSYTSNSQVNMISGNVISQHNTGISSEGKVKITGGEVTGVYINIAGELTLGEDDGNVSTSVPKITNKLDDNYGVYVVGKFNFYDGIITSGVGSSYRAINANTINTPTDYMVYRGRTDSNQEEAYLINGDAVAINVQTKKLYQDLQVAFNEATTGQTVRLLKDVDITASLTGGIGISSDYELTFDLNGYKLHSSDSRCITNRGKLIIVGETAGSTIEQSNSTLNNKDYRMAISNSGTLTIKSGYIVGEIHGVSSKGTDSKLYVEGGTIESSLEELEFNISYINPIYVVNGECVISGGNVNQLFNVGAAIQADRGNTTESTSTQVTIAGGNIYSVGEGININIGAAFSMTGGMVSGSSAIYDHNTDNGRRIKISGGKIQGTQQALYTNHTTLNLSGNIQINGLVRVNSSGSEVYMSDNAVVAGNIWFANGTDKENLLEMTGNSKLYGEIQGDATLSGVSNRKFSYSSWPGFTN